MVICPSHFRQRCIQETGQQNLCSRLHQYGYHAEEQNLQRKYHTIPENAAISKFIAVNDFLITVSHNWKFLRIQGLSSFSMGQDTALQTPIAKSIR